MRHEKKLTDGVREFKVCGKAKQMSKGSQRLHADENTEEIELNQNLLGSTDVQQSTRPRSIVTKRPVQSKQRSRSTPAAILSATGPILSPRSGQRR